MVIPVEIEIPCAILPTRECIGNCDDTGECVRFKKKRPLWLGCHLATSFSDYWHAAPDFSQYTICGIDLFKTSMSESKVTNRHSPCPRCMAELAKRKR